MPLTLQGSSADAADLESPFIADTTAGGDDGQGQAASALLAASGNETEREIARMYLSPVFKVSGSRGCAVENCLSCHCGNLRCGFTLTYVSSKEFPACFQKICAWRLKAAESVRVSRLYLAPSPHHTKSAKHNAFKYVWTHPIQMHRKFSTEMSSSSLIIKLIRAVDTLWTMHPHKTQCPDPDAPERKSVMQPSFKFSVFVFYF